MWVVVGFCWGLLWVVVGCCGLLWVVVGCGCCGLWLLVVVLLLLGVVVVVPSGWWAEIDMENLFLTVAIDHGVHHRVRSRQHWKPRRGTSPRSAAGGSAPTSSGRCVGGGVTGGKGGEGAVVDLVLLLRFVLLVSSHIVPTNNRKFGRFHCNASRYCNVHSPSIQPISENVHPNYESRQYLELPYTDSDINRRVFINGERARSWNSGPAVP